MPDAARTAPDPVDDAFGYRRLLLDALGDDDAAEVLSATPAELRVLVAEPGSRRRIRPAPREQARRALAAARALGAPWG